MRRTLIILTLIAGFACNGGPKRGGAKAFAPPKEPTPVPASEPDKQQEALKDCQRYDGKFLPEGKQSTDLKSVSFTLQNGKVKVDVVFADDTSIAPIVGTDPIDRPDGSTIAAGCNLDIVSVSYVTLDKQSFYRFSLGENGKLQVDLLDGDGKTTANASFSKGN